MNSVLTTAGIMSNITVRMQDNKLLTMQISMKTIISIYKTCRYFHNSKTTVSKNVVTTSISTVASITSN